METIKKPQSITIPDICFSTDFDECLHLITTKDILFQGGTSGILNVEYKPNNYLGLFIEDGKLKLGYSYANGDFLGITIDEGNPLCPVHAPACD